MKYLVTITETFNQFSTGHVIEANTLTTAKRRASAKFAGPYDLVKLETGDFLNDYEEGDIVNATAFLYERFLESYREDKKWINQADNFYRHEFS